MFTNAIGMMSDSAFGVQRNLNALTGLAGSGDDSRATLDKEKALTSDNLKKQFVYNASDLMADSQDKINKENIKRSFSIFA